jgi:hypothetical protein
MVATVIRMVTFLRGFFEKKTFESKIQINEDKECPEPNQAATQKWTAEERQAEKYNQTEHAAWLVYLN